MARSAVPETRDVWPRALLVFGGGLLLFLAIAAAILALIFDTGSFWPRPGASDIGNRASPPLQRSPAIDLATFRKKEDAELARLAWVDRSAGIVRIPIDDAMKIIAEKGLPDWSSPVSGTDGECGLLKAQVSRAQQAERCRAPSSQGKETRP